MWTAIWAFVKSLGLTKYIGQGIAFLVGGWASLWPLIRKYWYWFVIGIALLLIVAQKFWADSRIKDLTEQVHMAQLASVEYERSIEYSNQSFDQCMQVLQANEATYLAALERADAAERRIRDLRIEVARNIEEINDEAWNFRGMDADCRSLDDPLPDWFDDWLRN